MQAGIGVLTTGGTGTVTLPGGTGGLAAAVGQWFTRQWLYLKFCMPPRWLATGLLGPSFLALVLLRPGACSWRPGAGRRGAGLVAALFLAGLAGLGVYLRSLHPNPGPWGTWLLACFTAMGMASWLPRRTLFTREMRWRGIAYRVGWVGKWWRVVSSERLKTKNSKLKLGT